MMDHNMCFKGEIWKIIPKLFLLLLLIWSFGLALWKERGTGGVLEKLKEKALKGFRYRIDRCTTKHRKTKERSDT